MAHARRATPILHLAGAALARDGVDPRLADRALRGAVKDAIGARRGSLGDWWVDDAGWCVELLFAERETFRGLTLEFALAWCPVYLMTAELGIDGFAS